MKSKHSFLSKKIEPVNHDHIDQTLQRIHSYLSKSAFNNTKTHSTIHSDTEPEA